ncbi:MAG: prepilin-type N-terminal cleavage/methylation domain-containing protein, partial [Epulopiscium sp.]|nr:prepilin-type N-terminal cleavage/methylation domain-containing protein [Candidatus Epulonipiscium sp.]
MKKINKEGLRSEKGFTMIELIIVIAILGILAAILVPSFAQMTRKSRLNA